MAFQLTLPPLFSEQREEEELKNGLGEPLKVNQKRLTLRTKRLGPSKTPKVLCSPLPPSAQHSLLRSLFS
jgi:hypothetical protein